MAKKADHPCVIIFVPQKVLPWLVPDDEKAPEILETPDGKWCLTDVVTSGKNCVLGSHRCIVVLGSGHGN